MADNKKTPVCPYFKDKYNKTFVGVCIDCENKGKASISIKVFEYNYFDNSDTARKAVRTEAKEYYNTYCCGDYKQCNRYERLHKYDI